MYILPRSFDLLSKYTTLEPSSFNVETISHKHIVQERILASTDTRAFQTIQKQQLRSVYDQHQ